MDPAGPEGQPRGVGGGRQSLGKDTALEGVAGTSVFKVFDLEVARTGLNAQESKDAGFDPVEVAIKTRSRAHAHPGSATIHCQMVADKTSGRLLGGQLVGIEGAVHRINALAVALHQHMTVEAFSQCDLAYAPPFGPVWDPPPDHGQSADEKNMNGDGSLGDSVNLTTGGEDGLRGDRSKSDGRRHRADFPQSAGTAQCI